MNAPSVEIVEYAPELAPYFRTLNVEWLEKYFVVEPIDEAVLGDPDGRIIAGGGAILFARLDGDLVGTVALKHHGAGLYELTKMAVTARARGVGIGRRLLEACLRRYERLGGKRLFLESHSSLKAALHLYEAAGFRHVVRRTPSDYARADVYMVYYADENDEKSIL